MKQFTLGIENEIIVDNFAGGGGTSLGIEWAFRRPVDIAVNHDQEAVAQHMANHPQTRHYCEDVWDVDPRKATRGRKVGLAWFSPDCKHFSKAKGGRPVEKKIRGLAWVVIKWAKAVKPRVIMLENVEEFQKWGPLTKDGMPCPLRKGLTFRRWKRQLENLGYAVECKELRACDYGAPTIRKRLFVIARRDGLPIVWPEPTHGPGTRKPYRTAAECIEWSIPCPSIFERERPLAEATMRRIAKGIQRYVIDAKEPFIVPVTHHGDDRVHGIHEPFRTVTAAKRGEFALTVPTLIQTGYGERPGQEPRVPGLEKPLGTVVGCGQKHALVSAFLTKFRTGSVGSGMDEPVHTVTAGSYVKRPAGAGHAMGVVVAHLAQHNTGMVGHDARKPLSTIVGKGCTQALVTSNLVKLYGTAQHGQDVRDPAPTVTAGGWHIGEVRAFLIKYCGTDQDPLTVTVRGEHYQIADIGMRMLQPRELYRAQGFPDSYIIDCEYRGKPLTKTAQVRMCGNSVSPVVAKALVEANLMQRFDDIEQGGRNGN